MKRKKKLYIKTVLAVSILLCIFLSCATVTPREEATRRGFAAMRARNFDIAVDEFTEAIRLEPNRAASYSSRGNAYTELGEFELALADFNTAIAIQPERGWTPFPYYYRGLMYEKWGDYENAILDLEYALRIIAGDPTYDNFRPTIRNDLERIRRFWRIENPNL